MGLKANDTEIKKWVIYKIISPTGRIYIGKSINKHSRFNSYKNLNCKSQPLLYKSLLKYGYKAHKIEIIEAFDSDNGYASGKEMFWIRSNMSNTRKWPKMRGMNLTDGGEGTIGYKATISTRKKLSLAKKGKPPHNKGKKGEQVAWNKGLTGFSSPWNKGKNYSHLSDEEKKIKFGKHNIGNAYNKGRKQLPAFIAERVARQTGKTLEKKWKPVLQYSLSGEFIQEHQSLKHATINLGLSRAGVAKILSGEIKNPQSFRLIYKPLPNTHRFTFQRRIFKQTDLSTIYNTSNEKNIINRHSSNYFI